MQGANSFRGDSSVFMKRSPVHNAVLSTSRKTAVVPVKAEAADAAAPAGTSLKKTSIMVIGGTGTLGRQVRKLISSCDMTCVSKF